MCDNPDHLRQYYLDIRNNIRAHSTMRFAQLTLFIGITAALLSVLFEEPSSLTSGSIIFLKIAALLAVLVFYIMEERVADYFHHYRRCAVDLEKKLNYSQYSTSPKREVLTATNAVRFLFLATGIFWLAALFIPNMF